MGNATFRKVRNGVQNFFGNFNKLGPGLADSITTKKNVGIKERRKR